MRIKPIGISEDAAAKILGISSCSLRKMRLSGTGPRYFLAGVKLYRYRLDWLEQWMEAHSATDRAERSTAVEQRVLSKFSS